MRIPPLATTLSFLALCEAAGAPADLRNVAPDIVSLPEFQVHSNRELPPPEKWHYARVGQFEVLSNAPIYSTRSFVQDFLAFQNALQVVAPSARLRSEMPAALIICGKDRVFADLTRNARSADRITAARGGAILSDSELAMMLINFEDIYMQDVDEDYRFMPNEAFYQAYIKVVLSRMASPPPEWFREGLSRLVGAMKFTSNAIEFGNLDRFMRAGPGSFLLDRTPSLGASLAPDLGIDLAERDQWNTGYVDRTASGASEGRVASSDLTGYSGISRYAGDAWGGSGGWLQDDNRAYGTGSTGIGTVSHAVMPIIPLADFFGTDPASLRSRYIKEGRYELADAWAKQATAFVHLGLYGENKKYQKGFVRFLSRASQEPVTEKLFTECFGFGYDTMVKALERYITFAKYREFAWEATEGHSFTQTPDIELRPATDAEVGRIKGEAYRLAGSPEEARREFVTSYLRGQRDPSLLASLGLMARHTGDDRRARLYLERIASDTTVARPRAYVELARLRREYFERALGSQGKLSAGETKLVLTPLYHARSLRPLLPDLYVEVAKAWDRSAAKPTKDNLAVLLEGLTFFPRHAELTGRTAELHDRHGFKEEATRLFARLRPPTGH